MISPCLAVQEGVATNRKDVEVVVWRDYICRHGLHLRLWINNHELERPERTYSVLLSV
ncbi:hypothetical protein SAMN05443635_11369 [Roseobacter denitrificans OCh 114]|nr:hypothetical protein SAMN05443635_11369 [Roseobacter denitrificans OCh 114]